MPWKDFLKVLFDKKQAKTVGTVDKYYNHCHTQPHICPRKNLSFLPIKSFLGVVVPPSSNPQTHVMFWGDNRRRLVSSKIPRGCRNINQSAQLQLPPKILELNPKISCCPKTHHDGGGERESCQRVVSFIWTFGPNYQDMLHLPPLRDTVILLGQWFFFPVVLNTDLV